MNCQIIINKIYYKLNDKLQALNKNIKAKNINNIICILKSIKIKLKLKILDCCLMLKFFEN